MSEVEVGVEGRCGVIALNRPAAINALTLQMISEIRAALEGFIADPAISVILFEGRGERGFCSGGDVRAVREGVLAGTELPRNFFQDEYSLNGLIAQCPKPVAVIATGVVMGGGIGLAGHARYRFTTPGSRFAMPESAIGFVCDVGVNFILAKAMLHRALLFEMSGLPVGAGDALALGLADCAVLPERLAAVRAGIVAAASAGNPDTALVALMQAESITPGEPKLCTLADALADCFSETDAEDIVEAIEERAAEDPEIGKLAETLRSRSPTSLEAIVQSYLAARKLQEIEPILALDLRLAVMLAGMPDFTEGVRAVLVDKDQKPNWLQGGWDAVPREQIAAAVQGSP